MPQAHNLHNEEQLSHFCEMIRAEWVQGKKPVWQRTDPKSSAPQYRSLHVWCGQCAEFLNEAGLDMRVCLEKREADVPWTKQSFKDAVWKPLLSAMTTKESTLEQTTTECQKVAEVIRRHFGEKMGVTLPQWPDRFSRGREA